MHLKCDRILESERRWTTDLFPPTTSHGCGAVLKGLPHPPLNPPRPVAQWPVHPAPGRAYILRPTFYALRFTYEHPTRPPGLASYRVLAGLSAPQVLSDPHGAAIALDEGWHLVSLPEEPVDSDPAVVLASIAESYARVYAYDGCDPADPWKVYDPAHPETSDLRVIDHTKGLSR